MGIYRMGGNSFQKRRLLPLHYFMRLDFTTLENEHGDKPLKILLATTAHCPMTLRCIVAKVKRGWNFLYRKFQYLCVCVSFFFLCNVCSISLKLMKRLQFFTQSCCCRSEHARRHQQHQDTAFNHTGCQHLQPHWCLWSTVTNRVMSLSNGRRCCSTGRLTCSGLSVITLHQVQ